MRPITLKVPEGSMLNPRYPAAVVAGNVETSQVITDCLFAACRRAGAEPGDDEQFHLRQRPPINIMRRSPAAPAPGPDFDGASAVQTHMTNSRLTDPEILETRFPVLLERFAIRRGSGGDGRASGAATASMRHIRFREPMHGRHPLQPPRGCRRAGIEGGGDAQPGVNKVVRADGSEEMLTATASAEMAAGDVFVIETPGGGGYGERILPGTGRGTARSAVEGLAVGAPPPRSAVPSPCGED